MNVEHSRKTPSPNKRNSPFRSNYRVKKVSDVEEKGDEEDEQIAKDKEQE
jgi:hypothetical protein